MESQFRSAKHRQSGSFIIEALVSLLIFAVALISLVGLAVQSLNQTTQTKWRNDASNLAGDLISEMWVSASVPSAFDTTVSPSTSASATWLARVAAALPGSSSTVTVVGNRVTIQINWADRKDPTVPHFYITASEIVKN